MPPMICQPHLVLENKIWLNFYKSLLKGRLSFIDKEDLSHQFSKVIANHYSTIWNGYLLKQRKYAPFVSKLVKSGSLAINASIFKDVSKILCNHPDNLLDKKELNVNYRSNLLNIHTIDEIHEIARSPDLLTIASLYLGAPVVAYNFNAWWQYTKPVQLNYNNAQKWHRDRDSLNSLALFIYCTDVNKDNGPHLYMEGTHRSDTCLNQFSTTDDDHHRLILGEKHTFIGDDQWLQFQPKSSPICRIGESGTAFFEDTKGFHKGLPLLQGSRLVLRINWTFAPTFNSHNFKILE